MDEWYEAVGNVMPQTMSQGQPQYQPQQYQSQHQHEPQEQYQPQHQHEPQQQYQSHNGKGKGEIHIPVVEAKTLTESSNFCAVPHLTTGPVITKIPVVLAERTIQIDVEALIKLEQPAIEIKRILKTLVLTQCKLLPRVGKLFLSGFIRKNIEYATAEESGKDFVNGAIRHTTVEVPIETSTRIPFELGVLPVETPNALTTRLHEFDSKLMGRNPRVEEMDSTEFFNEPIFCELVSVRFNEIDIAVDDKEHRGEDGTFKFDKIKEKIVVLVTIKLLQLQQVKVCGLP